jgi:hypothetical protein
LFQALLEPAIFVSDSNVSVGSGIRVKGKTQRHGLARQIGSALSFLQPRARLTTPYYVGNDALGDLIDVIFQIFISAASVPPGLAAWRLRANVPGACYLGAVPMDDTPNIAVV